MRYYHGIKSAPSKKHILFIGQAVQRHIEFKDIVIRELWINIYLTFLDVYKNKWIF